MPIESLESYNTYEKDILSQDDLQTLDSLQIEWRGREITNIYEDLRVKVISKVALSPEQFDPADLSEIKAEIIDVTSEMASMLEGLDDEEDRNPYDYDPVTQAWNESALGHKSLKQKLKKMAKKLAKKVRHGARWLANHGSGSVPVATTSFGPNGNTIPNPPTQTAPPLTAIRHSTPSPQISNPSPQSIPTIALPPTHQFPQNQVQPSPYQPGGLTPQWNPHSKPGFPQETPKIPIIPNPTQIHYATPPTTPAQESSVISPSTPAKPTIPDITFDDGKKVKKEEEEEDLATAQLTPAINALIASATDSSVSSTFSSSITSSGSKSSSPLNAGYVPPDHLNSPINLPTISSPQPSLAVNNPKPSEPLSSTHSFSSEYPRNSSLTSSLAQAGQLPSAAFNEVRNVRELETHSSSASQPSTLESISDSSGNNKPVSAEEKGIIANIFGAGKNLLASGAHEIYQVAVDFRTGIFHLGNQIAQIIIPKDPKPFSEPAQIQETSAATHEKIDDLFGTHQAIDYNPETQQLKKELGFEFTTGYIPFPGIGLPGKTSTVGRTAATLAGESFVAEEATLVGRQIATIESTAVESRLASTVENVLVKEKPPFIGVKVQPNGIWEIEGKSIKKFDSSILSNENKMNHIFKDPRHQLDKLELTPRAAFEKTAQAIIEVDKAGGIPANQAFVTRIEIEGHIVEVRGIVDNGELKIGTFFIPER